MRYQQITLPAGFMSEYAFVCVRILHHLLICTMIIKYHQNLLTGKVEKQELSLSEDLNAEL